MIYQAFQFLAVLLAALTPMSYARVPERIIDGQKASSHEFPYQVLLVWQTKANGTTLCGGAIIDTTNILTAAHCFYFNGSLLPTDIWRVFTGSDDWRHLLSLSQNVFGILSVTAHPNYNRSGEEEHDIAIVKLKRGILFDDHQTSAVLANKDVAVNTKVMLTGWGLPAIDGVYPNPYLQKLEGTVISQTECRAWLASSKVHSNELCTWSDRRGTPCSGDSGSPLSSNGVVVGILSKGTCDVDYPAIFTKVNRYRSWIRRVI